MLISFSFKKSSHLEGYVMKAISFFAGVGGIDLGFEIAGIETILANEIDSYAAETYKNNFKNKVIVDDIKNIKTNELPVFEILLAGFPCQAFSVAGYRKGFSDDRGNLFFEIVRILVNKKPEVVFLENVKNLLGHDDGNTFKVILNSLNGLGYKIKYQVLNACEYGNIPQNRERIYIVGFLDETKAEKFSFPNRIPLKKKLIDIIDFEKKVDEKYYYSNENCNFFDNLKEQITNVNTIYQWRRVYVRENKSELCPTLTANMGTGGHNVPLVLTKYGIRKLTPRECFKLQGFEDTFCIPSNISNSRLYKQAGNSVVVSVVERIAKEIKKVMEEY